MIHIFSCKYYHPKLSCFPLRSCEGLILLDREEVIMEHSPKLTCWERASLGKYIEQYCHYMRPHHILYVLSVCSMVAVLVYTAHAALLVGPIVDARKDLGEPLGPDVDGSRREQRG